MRTSEGDYPAGLWNSELRIPSNPAIRKTVEAVEKVTRIKILETMLQTAACFRNNITFSGAHRNNSCQKSVGPVFFNSFSAFPYSAFPDCVLEGIVARAIRLYEQEPGEAEASSRFGLYVRRWVRWTGVGLAVADIPARNGVVAG